MAKKNWFLGIPALASVFLLAACGEITNINDDDALYELTGKWYNNLYDFVFEITPEGEAYIAESKTQCTVSVSGRFVYFLDSHGNIIGSFSYSIKNGELTMKLGMGDFINMSSASPFIKSGVIPSGGSVPVEFIGVWRAKNRLPPSSGFEIAKSGEMIISGSTAQYTAVVQGNRVFVLDGSILRGEFQYSFIYGEMFVTNGTDICTGLAVLSPFVKKSGLI
jgi:hypothetical protein